MTSRRKATAGSSAPLGPESFAPAPGEIEAVDEGWGDEGPKVPGPAPIPVIPMIPPAVDSGDAPRAPIPTEDFEGGLDFRGELPTLEIELPPARLEMPTVRVSPGEPPREAFRSVHPNSTAPPPRSSMPTVEHSDPQVLLQGIRFRARRTGDGQNGDGRRGVRGSD